LPEKAEKQIKTRRRIMNRKKRQIIKTLSKVITKSRLYNFFEQPTSLEVNKNIVYKFFHQCSHIQCNRTFASAGWYKAHLAAHLEELKEDKFNSDFQRLTKLNKKDQ
jgi:hypothetical protein